jgi:hypothetical protein
MAREKYQVTLRRERFRPLPKKLLQHVDIPVKKGYTTRATIWVADTPESNLRPTVNLTVSHGHDRIRFCFQNAADLIIFIDRLREFVGEKVLMAHDKHTRAVEEFLAYHEDNTLPLLNDTTEYTVLQGKEGVVVDMRTGEILERWEKGRGN